MTYWYHEAEQALSDVAAAVEGRHAFSMQGLDGLAADLVSSLQCNDELVVEALSGPTGSPLVSNLINVAVLGTKVGVGLGYYGEELRKLALAGLVHDIGLFTVPKSVITKAGRLTQEERTLIEQHPVLGYQVVEKCGTAYNWLAQLVGQAHERFNGQGYPKGLKGRQISEMALIIGVVDVFDALVSERPYRRRLYPHEAVKELLVAERTTFPREILKALVQQFSVYPLGTTVRLTTGEVGVVAKVNRRYPLRPVVRIDDQQGSDGEGAHQIDLSLMPLISVADILNAPTVGRIRFAETSLKCKKPVAPTVVSDHFTALLESLDAVASTIQGAVHSRQTALKQPEQSIDNHGGDADSSAGEPA